MRQYLATVRPRIDTGIATAFAAHDLLFDWHRFEIPEGEACIKNFNIIMPGTNTDATSAENVLDFTFFIARAVNGAAPSSLGTVNGATNGQAATKIGFAGSKNHIVYTQTVDGSLMASAATYTQGYTLFSSATMNTVSATQAAQVANALQPGGVNIGNSTYPGNYNDSTSQPGMQSFWIAGITNGAHDLGTGLILDGAQAAVAKSSTSETSLAIKTVDADDILSVGDELIASDGAKIGKVTEVVSDVLIKVDHVEEALEDDDEICVRNPIIFNFGLEY